MGLSELVTFIYSYGNMGNISFNKKIVEALISKQRLLERDAIIQLDSITGPRVVRKVIIHQKQDGQNKHNSCNSEGILFYFSLNFQIPINYFCVGPLYF